MSVEPDRRDAKDSVVSAQLGRTPREPWRVAARCSYGYPTVIVSPSLLADGTPFPNYAWLTCPYLIEVLSARESAGAAREWADRAATDDDVAGRLAETDSMVRALRAAESGGADACAPVGLAGQRDPLGVKCVHAHVALALVGVPDPIGVEELGKIEPTCSDGRCVSLMT